MRLYLPVLCAAVALLACKDTKVRRAPGDPRFAIEFRPAATEPLSGYSGPVPDPEGKSLFLGPEAVLGNADIKDVAVEARSAGYGVMLFFTAQGASRLSAFTAGHIGQPLAVLIDGKVAIAPVIRSVISESAVIEHGFSEEEALRIAHGLAP